MSPSVGVTCATCRYWNPGRHSRAMVASSACQFMPPVLVPLTQTGAFGDSVATDLETRFPETGPETWCGQWKAVAED